jgi:hypothetical protein
MDNPRKKLYNSLISSNDPDVKEHFSQWSEDEFDKKLSDDKNFQKDLFLDLKDIGLAKDEATFTKDYLSKPVAPAASVEPKTTSSRMAYEKLDGGKETTASKILSGIGKGVDMVAAPIGAITKGVSGLVSAAKQMVGLKSEDAKYEEAQKKREAGSVSGFAGSDELGKIGQYETAASEFRAKQKQKAQAEKPMMSRASFEGPGYIPPSGLSPEDKKAYEKSQQEYRKLFSEASPVFQKQAEAAAKKAKSDPSAYKKDKYGKTVPDPLWVAKEARDIATKAGAPAGGYAENFLQSNIESALMYEQKSPEFVAEADKLSLEKYGKKLSEWYSEDVYKNVQPVQVYQDKLNAASKKAKQTISAEYKPKFDAVNNEYNSAITNYKASVANDPSIKQAVNEYDAKNVAELQRGVNEGVLSVEQANAMLTSKDSMDARSAYINGIVDKKYGTELKTAYNKYLTGVNVLNNKRNARLRRQSDELEEYYNAQYKNQIDIAKKTYKISPERAKLLENLQKQAYDNVMGREMQDKRRYDMNASVWENFMSSSLKGLGEGIQSTAFTLGMEDVASFGNLLAKNFDTSDLTINSWSDVGFGQEGLTKFAMSAGNILGRMSPGLAASAGVAYATGGLGLGTLPSMLLAGVPSAAFETADIMGSVEQQMLSQSTGDIAKAQQAGSRALESQLKIWPTYLLDGLPFFPKLLKFAGKSKYAGLNILTRGLAGGGINLVTETAQEVPQNVFEEIILADKDPTFSELYKNTTAEKIANTSASVVSMSLLMGSAPQVIDSSKDAIAKRAAAGYFAKQVLNEASHPGLMVENQSQFLTQLADQKNPRFAAQMVNILFQKGNIDKARAEVLAKKLDNYERFKETALGKSDNQIVRQAGFILFDRYTEARNSKNKEAEEASLKALQDYATTGNAELVMLRTPDGSYNVYTYDDLNNLMADEDFQKASRESNDKYGALFEITPLVQTQEGLQNPKLQEVLSRFEAIQAPAEEVDVVVDEVTETSKPQPIDDEKILEGQKRAGVEAPKLFDIVPVEAAAVVDAVRSGEEGITAEELSGASNAMYQLHKMYEKMRVSTTRNLTLAQIDNITSDLEQAITDLENHKTRLAVGDEEMSALEQQDKESEQTVEAITEQPAAEAEAPVEAAPTAPAMEPAPTAEAAPEAPQKPKAKVNLFTDEDAVNSFTQKQMESYEKLLFDGEDDAARQMVDTQKQRLINRETEQVARGEISEKVKAFYKKFGIEIETLSADDFVNMLKENGEAASRSQEGVFDDKNGKIYINKDAFDLGFGTTVVWHEAIHPIMNIIHNSNKALYDKIHRGINAAIKANPRGGLNNAKEWVDGTYTNEKGYNDASRKDELIVEVIARLASGRLSFNELQPTLRQQFIDLINRIGRIMGLSKGETNDMKAIKDLVRQITSEINKAGEGDLSKIVGIENVGKFQKPVGLSEKMAASLSRETQAKVVPGQSVGTRKPSAKKSPDLAYNKDLLIGLEATKANPMLYKFNAMLVASYDIMYPVLPPTIKNYLNGIYKTLNKYQNEADTLKEEIDALKKEIVKITAKQEKLKTAEAEKLTNRIIAGEVKKGGYGRLISDLKKKMDRREQLTQKDGLLPKERERVRKEMEAYAKDKMTMQMADRIYKEFIGITQSNLEALVDLFPARLREVAKLWYDGANLIAQGFAKSYKTSIEQASAVLAVFSPQKDWFMNISLAERLMNIYNNMMDYKFDDAMASKYLKRAGEPELSVDEKTGEDKWTGGAVPLLDEDGEHVEIDGVLQFKNWDNEKAKERIEKAANTLKELRGKSLRELLDAGNLDLAARFVRMYSEVYDSPNFSFYTPDGRKGYESRSEKGTLRKIAWGGYNTIEKALRIMEATEKNKMDVIHDELGEMHKVRSFYNNIADPLSKSGHVTMDTHAIAAILWKALSGASFEVTQNFGGAGTKSEAAIGSNGLYPVFAEAYREAANNLGYLPREIQSITWEAVRMLFKAKWKGNKENVKKIGNIWAKFRNGELTIEQAREQIWKLATAGERGLIAEAIRNGEGVGSPDWAEILDSGLDPEKTKRANDTVRLSMGGGIRYDGERGVGRRGAATTTPGVVSGPAEGGKPGGLELGLQKSLGGREEQSKSESENEREQRLRSERAGDGGVRNISGAEAPLAGAPTVQGATGPDPNLVDIAKRYALKAGIPYRRQSEYVKVDPERAGRIADAYQEMPHDPKSPEVKEAYADLIRQTKAQYQALVDDGYEFSFFDGKTDPYDENPNNAMRDLRANKRMAVYGTYDGYGTEGITGAAVEDNPMLEPTGLKWPDQKGVMHDVTANDLFRAVHDAFGHGLEGSGFRARGEENAWQAHVRLFTGPAVAAITSETRGQNSWLNFNSNLLKDVVGPEKAKSLHPDNWETITVGEHNRNAKLDDTIFAEQKTGLMPEWTWSEGLSLDMEEGVRGQASLGGRVTGTILFDKEGNKLVSKGDEFEVDDLVSSMNHPVYAPIFAWYKNNNKKIGAYGGRGNDAGLAWYNSNTKEIKLNINHSLAPKMHGSQEDLDSTIAHEIIHSIVDDYIQTNKKAFDEFNSELSDLRDILKAQDQTKLPDSLKQNIEYILGGNPEEMVTYALTNPEVAAYFNTISVTSKPGAKTIWNKIVDAILGIVDKAINDKSLLSAVTETLNKYTNSFSAPQASLGGRAEQAFSSIDKALDMPPVKSKAARAALVDEYGKEAVDQMIEITRNFTKIIDGLEEKGVVEKDCP